MPAEMAFQTSLRDKIIQTVLERIGDARLNGHGLRRLPNNINFSFAKINGESLIMSLDMKGIAVSMGAACTSGALEPSHVLRSLGLSDELALGSLRITIGRWTTGPEIDHFLESLIDAVSQLRQLSNASQS